LNTKAESMFFSVDNFQTSLIREVQTMYLVDFLVLAIF